MTLMSQESRDFVEYATYFDMRASMKKYVYFDEYQKYFEMNVGRSEHCEGE